MIAASGDLLKGVAQYELSGPRNLPGGGAVARIEVRRTVRLECTDVIKLIGIDTSLAIGNVLHLHIQAQMIDLIDLPVVANAQIPLPEQRQAAGATERRGYVVAIVAGSVVATSRVAVIGIRTKATQRRAGVHRQSRSDAQPVTEVVNAIDIQRVADIASQRTGAVFHQPREIPIDLLARTATGTR